MRKQGCFTLCNFGNGCILLHFEICLPARSGTATGPISTIEEWAYVSTGESHTVAIEGGTLWAWGSNANGRLGDGTWQNRFFPVQIGTASNWATVSAGESHTVAIRTDGTLWAWGNRLDGRIGQGGTTGSQTTPIQVVTATNWASVSAGESHTVAIRTDGTLWAWGNRLNGRIGQGGTSGSQTTPIQIGAATNWATVSAGISHTVATRTDGTLWAWGSRLDGRIGQGGTTGSQSIPIQVGTETNWAHASAGGSHTVAVRTDGTLWVWGSNWNGQLGNGEATGYQPAPIQIGTATNWATVSAKGNHTVAVRTDGTAWAWGNNWNGQLGDGTTTSRNAPVQIGTATNWASVAAGNYFSTGIRENGTLWAWGRNASGQIGDGTTTHRHSPVQVLP